MSAILGDPATHAYVVTPSDTANLPTKATSLLLSNFSAGAVTIQITTVGGETLTIAFGTLTVASAPIALPIQVAKVWSTSTSGIGTIVALFQ